MEGHIKHPDFYGIDTPNYPEIASHTNMVETKLVGATSLFFLSLEWNL